MIDNRKLLSYLSDTDYVSGTFLGKELGVSRAAIGDRLRQLCAHGLPLDTQKAKGYGLHTGVKLLCLESIQENLAETLKTKVRLEVIHEIESTNDYLKSSELEQGVLKLCAAEKQTAGRGRTGNQWFAGAYRNIILSASWRFEGWPQKLSGLSLALGIVLARLFRDEYNLALEVKWPNDLFFQGHKIGGILVDVSGEAGSYCDLVMGLGLNVYQDQNTVKNSDYPIGDLNQFGIEVDRNQLIAQIAEAWFEVVSQFETNGLTPYLESWKSLSMFNGKRVSVDLPDESFEGIVMGVDEWGALLVDVSAEGNEAKTKPEHKRVLNSMAKVRLV